MPAVDLREGKCVRLTKGKPGTEETYYDDPIDAAKYWWEQGAEIIHLIDLDDPGIDRQPFEHAEHGVHSTRKLFTAVTRFLL